MKGAEEQVTMRLSPVFSAVATDARLSPIGYSVAPVLARGVTSGVRYTYVSSAAPGEIRQAATYFWEEAPPRILERALVAGLRTRFASVSGPDVSVPQERRITATLERFEESDSGGAARAVVAFSATSVSGGKAVSSGRYCGSAPIAGAAGSDRARAFETAIVSAVDGLVQDVSGSAGMRTFSDC